MEKLAQLGCGFNMMSAIASIYKCTRMILRTAIITASLGVRQGSPTSCLLFVLGVNELIQKLKQREPDGFLGWLHSMIMMDDTILLATSRERAEEKLTVLKDFCRTSGMVINREKTKFMVINGNVEDRNPLRCGDSHSSSEKGKEKQLRERRKSSPVGQQHVRRKNWASDNILLAKTEVQRKTAPVAKEDGTEAQRYAAKIVCKATCKWQA